MAQSCVLTEILPCPILDLFVLLIYSIPPDQKTTPKGVADTALSVKNATLSNGAVVKVPLFIEIGNEVKVTTEDGTYVDKL